MKNKTNTAQVTNSTSGLVVPAVEAFDLIKLLDRKAQLTSKLKLAREALEDAPTIFSVGAIEEKIEHLRAERRKIRKQIAKAAKVVAEVSTEV